MGQDAALEKSGLPALIEDWPLAAIDVYQERLAIMCADGGLPEVEARTLAQRETRRLWDAGEIATASKRDLASELMNVVADLIEPRYQRALLPAKRVEVSLILPTSLRLRILIDEGRIGAVSVEDWTSPE